MKDTIEPVNRRKYDTAFRAVALRLAAQSRSTQGPPGRSLLTRHASPSGKRPPRRQLRLYWGRPWTRPRMPDCASCRPWPGGRRWTYYKKPLPAPASRAGSRRRRTNELLPLHQRRARPPPRAAALPSDRGAGQWVLGVANGAAAGGGGANTGLGNGLGQYLWGPPAPLWHLPVASHVA